MKLRRRNKVQEKAQRSTLKELPYFTFRGNLALFHGQFNNSVSTTSQLSKRKAKQLSKPWITTGLKASIMVKNKLFVGRYR